MGVGWKFPTEGREKGRRSHLYLLLFYIVGCRSLKGNCQTVGGLKEEGSWYWVSRPSRTTCVWLSPPNLPAAATSLFLPANFSPLTLFIHTVRLWEKSASCSNLPSTFSSDSQLLCVYIYTHCKYSRLHLAHLYAKLTFLLERFKLCLFYYFQKCRSSWRFLFILCPIRCEVFHPSLLLWVSITKTRGAKIGKFPNCIYLATSSPSPWRRCTQLVRS